MKELKNLLKVKSILSILFSVTTCYMALTMAIITYYFTRKENNDDK